MTRKLFPLLGLSLVLALALGACAAPATPTEAPAEPPAPEPTALPPEPPMEESTVPLPEVDPSAVSGDIITAGSSTVFPLTERMAELFNDDGYTGEITVDSIGTGAGFERFCVAGETDISNASRPIKDSEIESCGLINRTPVEFRVGTDALAVVVSAENDFATDVTLEELALLFSTAETWADVRAEWPAEPVLRFSPGTDSGTFDYFVEVVMDKNEEPLLAASNLQLSEDDNILVQGVQGSPYAIGYFGYAYFVENEDVLKALSIEGVTPTAESVDDASYPLARPLFIYSDAAILQAKPQVAAFINYYLTHVNEEVVDVGYFPASVAAWDASRQAFLDALDASVVILPEVDPSAVSGDIITAGSSTVFPLTERMAELFNDDGYTGEITVDSIGTGAGFERFCVAGETDISNASRPIKDEEIASCEGISRSPIEFRVGTDALAVVVSAENDFATDVTLEELALLFSTAETWADVRAEWPAEPVLRFSPGTDSGTFDYFVEAVMDKNEEPLLATSNLQLSEDDNILVQGVQGSPYAIGYFGYAYFQENDDVLKALNIEGVTPSAETVNDGSYALARPLFIYSDAAIMQAKPQVAAFLNYYLTHVNEEIRDVGYFPAGEALELAKQAWLDAQ
jgi:phosphate binding protein